MKTGACSLHSSRFRSANWKTENWQLVRVLKPFMRRVLFIDRDGTIIREPHDFQVDLLEKLRFLPGAITNLAKIARETDFAIVMVTNQDGLGTEGFPETAFYPAQNFVIQTLADEGVEFADVFVDRT